MAGLQQRSGSYRVIFRYHGKQHTLHLGEVSKKEAEAKSAQVDYLLLRLKQRLIEVPAGIGIVDFVQYDGKPPAPRHDDKAQGEASAKLGNRGVTTMVTLRD